MEEMSEKRSSLDSDGLRPITSKVEKYPNKRMSLPIRMASINEEKSNVDVQKSEMKVLIKKQQILEVIKCYVINCKNLDGAFGILTSKSIKAQHPHPDALYLFKIGIGQPFADFGWRQGQLLNKKFKHKAVLIYIWSMRQNNFLIYWKLQSTPELLKLIPYNEKFDEEDKLLCKFVAKFLKKSIRKGQLGLLKDYSIEDDGTKVQLHLLANHKDLNLLMIAAKLGNGPVVNSLLKYHIPVENRKYNLSAQDLAWQYGHNDIVLEMVEANFTYPKLICPKKCSEKLRNFISIAEELHKAIKNCDYRLVRKLVTENTKQRYFYYPSNVSALKVAMLLENWEVYQILIENGCQFGSHEDTTELLGNLDRAERAELLTIHSQYLRDFYDTHINILMANTHLASYGDDDKYQFNLILTAYQALDESRFTNSILKVVAASKKICVIFDFNRESACRIDPSADPGAYTFLGTSGRISIGARQLLQESTRNKTYAVLAHALCNYAVFLMYGNLAKPYKQNDPEGMKKFEEISQICRENTAKDDMIEYIFRVYPEKFQHAELIACVPQLLILYQDDRQKVADLFENFKSLFNFYVINVMGIMENTMNLKDNRISMN